MLGLLRPRSACTILRARAAQCACAGPRCRRLSRHGLEDASGLAQQVGCKLVADGTVERDGLEGFPDMAVYGNGRCLRLAGSSKYGSKSVLSFDRVASHGSFGEACCTDLLPSTLIVPPEHPEVTLAVAAEQEEPTARTHAQGVRKRGLEPPVAPAPCHAGWRRRFEHLTDCPRVDMPLLPHPFIACTLAGTGTSPAPLEQLGVWGAEQLCHLGAGPLLLWRYERATEPVEVLMHLTGSGGVCHHIGRSHRSCSIMVSIDMVSWQAWQRCWDQSCVVRSRGGYVKAKKALGIVPPASRPGSNELSAFEAMHA